MSKLEMIINADDFGWDHGINCAVAESFRRGFCSSASVMPNMAGFIEACEMSQEAGLKDCVGLHLVLRDGMPLTDRMKKVRRFCDSEGRLSLERSGGMPILYLDGEERRVLADEVRAQIRRCRAAGIPLTHLDSHYHLHNEWAVAQVVIPVAAQEGIPYVRIARNCGADLSFPKRCYKTVLNRFIRRRGMARTRYFGPITGYVILKRLLAARTADPLSAIGSFEVMIHPKLNSAGTLTDDDGRPLETCLQEVDGVRHG